MKNYVKKPIRIDYYPKSKESIEEAKDVKVHLSANSNLDQNRTTDYNRNVEKLAVNEDPILKCGDSIVDHIEIIEEQIFNKTGEVEDIKEIEEEIEELGDIKEDIDMDDIIEEENEMDPLEASLEA